MILTRLRALRTAVRATLAPESAVSRVPLRVSLLDCDVNLHLTNSRYLHFMDLGRIDFFVRSGLWRKLGEGYRPIVVEAHIRFLREMRPATHFLLDTRVVTIENKAVTFEQTFVVRDEIHASGHVVVLVVQDGRVVTPDLLRPYLTQPLLTDGDKVLTH